MQSINPRLARLLDILYLADAPESIEQLAKRCGVSRRTIFREMENVDALLRPYGLSVGTKINEGVYLSGGPEEKEKLRTALDARNAVLTGLAAPGRGERRTILALDLLVCGEAQKLSYYADVFKTSEATVSNDLNHAEEKLNKYGLSVLRRPGRGVALSGGEAAARNAICAILLEARRGDMLLSAVLDYPPPDIAGGVKELVETRFKQQLAWMTEESREAFEVYMGVTVERIAAGNAADETEEPYPDCLTIADFFANSLELRFSIVFSERERKNLAVYLSALRKGANVFGKFGKLGKFGQFDTFAEPSEAAGDFLLKSLAYRMIERFDPELAPFLKLDDRLVDGLALHMQSAVVRIKNRIELHDPLYGEIARAYPDILEKSRLSLDALTEDGQNTADAIKMPESEASFLATHFGAAVMRIREHGRRRLRVGVVCGGGIGTSYFLLSQLKKHFPPPVEFEICGLGDVEDWSGFDLCVTSIPLDVPIPTARVNLLLEDGDVAAIRLLMESLSAAEKKAAAAGSRSLLELCENAAGLLSDARAILTYFSVVTIENDCDFDQLAKLAGYRFGEIEESGRLIYEDLIRRESMSTQVVPALELILLHTRTEGVKNPIFALIVPEGGTKDAKSVKKFTSPALQNSRCCVVMLTPPKVSRDTLNLMGRISSALLEDARFLNAVLDGDHDGVYRGLEENFRGYLADNIIFRKD